MDIVKKKTIKIFKGHENNVLTLKKINHPLYGECLISQGYEQDNIKLWISKI